MLTTVAVLSSPVVGVRGFENGRLRRMARINEGRVAIGTGAGRGIGRCHALALAHQADDFLDPGTLGPIVDELPAKAIPPTPMLGDPS